MTDNDELDEKIIAIPFEEPQMNHWKDITDLPKHVFTEIQHFFSVYKSLEHTDTSLQEVENRARAVEIIDKCLKTYKVHFRIHD